MRYLTRSILFLCLFGSMAFAYAIDPGAPAPAFNLPSTTGSAVSLKDYAGKSKVVLIFYRGYWCPFCRKQLSNLVADYEKFRSAGAEVLAVSADSPEKNMELAAALKLTFPVLSDADRKVIESYGVLDGEAKISKPAVFVIDRKGTVTWAYVGKDKADRPFNNLVLEQVQGAQ